jgi:hypothetical protein
MTTKWPLMKRRVRVVIGGALTILTAAEA